MKRMKKIICFLGVILALGFIFAGCADSSGSDNGNKTAEDKDPDAPPPQEEDLVSVTICLAYGPELQSNATWNVWAWAVSANKEYSTAGWPGNLILIKDETNGGYRKTLTVDSKDDLGLLFVTSTEKNKTSDILIDKSLLTEGKTFFFVHGDKTPYNSIEECAGLKQANINSKDGNTVVVNIYGCSDAKKEDFSVKGSDDTEFTISELVSTELSATITLSNGDISKRPYTVTYKNVSVIAQITSGLIEELELKYDGDDLGLTLDGATGTFKVWAPLASEVDLLVYSDASKIGSFMASTVEAKAIGSCDEEELYGEPAVDPIKMGCDSNGVWYYTLGNATQYKYYKYRIVNNGKTYYVCDIYAKVAAPDSIAAQIVNIDDSSATPSSWEGSYTNPWSSITGDYTDAIIYEMHIRDWSRAVKDDSTGKFLDIANSEKIINHLKDLGITHVQILPMFDYAQVNADKNYNWGYNPYHYNVPEGRYVTDDYTDGTQAVQEMRTMIKAFHDAGIAVIMDVVYNHTNGTMGGSLYDSTVPGYYYRLENGSYKNGSGCGNETATNHEMYKKYLIDSLKHWMNDYHINGFRFDLMGVHEKSTMKEIYDELYKIDSKVMVYGEPWRGDQTTPTDAAFSAIQGTSGMGAGAFDDDFRDAIKGAEYGGFKLGQVQISNSDEGILLGLLGKAGSNKRNETGLQGLGLHYAECHDNYTLFDKLALSQLGSSGYCENWVKKGLQNQLGKTKLTLVKNQQKLAGAYILLAQGTPFINGGQEFCRTKKGCSDSYAASIKDGIEWTDTAGPTNIDDVNKIDLTFKETYSDVYNVYKGLIALRKANSGAFGANASASATKVSAGVTKYTTGDFLVYFNATDSDVAIETAGYTKAVDVTSGTPTESELPAKVGAKSFVILKK